jgi:hypothetical protein
LNVIFSGSSVLQIHEQDADLSRRALMYKMPGLSFREYLQLSHGIIVEKIKLEALLQTHENWTQQIIRQFRPLALWPDYLVQGYFPFFIEKERDYMLTLEQILKYVIEVDFQLLTVINLAMVKNCRPFCEYCPWRRRLHPTSVKWPNRLASPEIQW